MAYDFPNDTNVQLLKRMQGQDPYGDAPFLAEEGRTTASYRTYENIWNRERVWRKYGMRELSPEIAAELVTPQALEVLTKNNLLSAVGEQAYINVGKVQEWLSIPSTAEGLAQWAEKTVVASALTMPLFTQTPS